MDDVIFFVGARGGQGTSTVAAVTALHAASQAPTSLLCADPLATAALLGAPAVLPGEHVEIGSDLTLAGLDGPRGVLTVIDAGPVTSAPPAPPGANTIAVVRGPCYLALHTVVAHHEFEPNGIVVVSEPGRSLSELDVAEIVGAPVLATVPVRPAISRVVDAGELLSAARGRAELFPLRTLVDHLAPGLAIRHDLGIHQPTTVRRAHLTVAPKPRSLDIEVA